MRQGGHETSRRHRDGHRLIHRQQHPGSPGQPTRGEVRHLARRRVREAWLQVPGAGHADARSGRHRSTAAPCASSARALPGTTSPWSRRSAIPASRTRTFPIRAPASSWARAVRRPRRSSKPPISPARRAAPSASVPSPCPRRCRRPRRRRSPPGSRSRASTIRSRRPARPPTTASATAANLIQWGKQDMVFAGGSEELNWTMSNLFDAMGAMSSILQCHAGQGLARLRQGP